MSKLAGMPLPARRVFRLGFTVALSLAFAYGLSLDLPFVAPIFALLFTAAPAPPMPPAKVLALAILVMIMTAVGLLLIRVLEYYAFSGVLLVGAGVYLANNLTLNLGKGPVGTLLTLGLTLISALGTMSWELAESVIDALVLGIIVAFVCQRVVYPFFPEGLPRGPAAAQPPQTPVMDRWIALRATLVVMPVYLLTLTNPALYVPIVMKSVSLGQQVSVVDSRAAGRELLGSTFLGGCFALLIWFGLGIATNLWMFFLWILLFVVFCAAKMNQVVASRYPASFWSNVVITALILLGSAVQDSDTGKDVYKAFAVRMALFLVVTVYALLTVSGLEYLRSRSSALVRDQKPN